MPCLDKPPRVSATVVWPDRWLGLAGRLAGCVAAILAAVLIGAVSFGSSPALTAELEALAFGAWWTCPRKCPELGNSDLTKLQTGALNHQYLRQLSCK